MSEITQRLVAVVAEYDREIDTLRAENERLQSDVQRVETILQSVRSERDYAVQQLGELRAENERLLRELGVTRSQLLGQRVADGVEEGASFHRALHAAMLTENALDAAMRGEAAGGKE